jgi:hypothetical protein
MNTLLHTSRQTVAITGRTSDPPVFLGFAAAGSSAVMADFAVDKLDPPLEADEVVLLLLHGAPQPRS